VKKQLRSDKLALRKETVRTLKAIELGDVVGGDVTSTVRSLAQTCKVGQTTTDL